ncbi:MAG: rhodanese-like domain-containing protein [Armatimonadota bacterium]
MSIFTRLTTLLGGAPAEGATGYQRISAKEARERLAADRGIVLLDVRSPGEHRARRIAGSMLIPHMAIGQQAPKQLPQKDATLIVYCQSGMRSRQAAQQLLALGYTCVYDLGGIMSWPYETVSG